MPRPVLALAHGAALAAAVASASGACARTPEIGPGSPAPSAVVNALPTRAPYRRDPTGQADSLHATALIAQGVAYRAGRATVWVPRDSLAPAHAQALTDSLARAIPAIEEMAGLPAPWARHARPSVQYFLTPGPGYVMHGDGGARVFIPLRSVRAGLAGYLHETTHVLTLPRRKTSFEAADSAEFARMGPLFAFWLLEGSADYVGKTVAQRIGFHEGDALGIGRTEKELNATCAALVAEPGGDSIVAHVGRNGMPSGLHGGDPAERRRVAAPFYACSHSFVRFLAAKFGTPRVVALLDAPDAEAGLAALGGGSVDALRADWRATLPAPAARKTP